MLYAKVVTIDNKSGTSTQMTLLSHPVILDHRFFECATVLSKRIAVSEEVIYKIIFKNYFGCF